MMSWMPTNKQQLQRFLIKMVFEQHRRFGHIVKLLQEIAGKTAWVE